MPPKPVPSLAVPVPVSVIGKGDHGIIVHGSVLPSSPHAEWLVKNFSEFKSRRKVTKFYFREDVFEAERALFSRLHAVDPSQTFLRYGLRCLKAPPPMELDDLRVHPSHPVWMCTQLYSGTSDLEHLPALATPVCARLLLNLMDGLQRLDEAMIVHSDLKAANVIVDTRQWRLYIIDFSRAKIGFPNVPDQFYRLARGLVAKILSLEDRALLNAPLNARMDLIAYRASLEQWHKQVGEL